MKTKILTTKLSDDKIDSFWYRDCEIAEIEHKDRKFIIEARGEIRLQFEEDGTIYKNEQAVDEAIDRGLNDNSLSIIGLFDGWHNNNWFSICEIDNNGNIGDDLEIAHDYNEALKTAKELIKNLVE